MMEYVKNKNFITMFVEVIKANPNGDPLAENMPRTDSQGHGMISAECLKRKLRNAAQVIFSQNIVIKSDEFADDGCYSVEERLKKDLGEDFLKAASAEEIRKKVCELYWDVRAFGGVLMTKSSGKKGKKGEEPEEKTDGLSVGIRGAVSVSMGISESCVETSDMEIVKSTNGMDVGPNKKDSSRMGMKHYVEYGLYRINIDVNPYIAERTGFSEKDLEILVQCLESIFELDSSAARPAGSMNVRKIVNFACDTKHGVNPAVAFGAVKVTKNKPGRYAEEYEDYDIVVNELPGVKTTVIDF